MASNNFSSITHRVLLLLDKIMAEKVKRVWCYIQKPAEHDIQCTKCKGINLDWSEWARHVWCRDCEIDFDDYTTALSGPVPVMLAHMLGLCMDEYNLETEEVRYFNFDTRDFITVTAEEYRNRNKVK